jgi:phosphoribosylformylglycinamidine cyclo-ligase
VLPKGVDVTVDPSSWEEPRIFAEIRRHGDIDQDEMRKVFNLGIGMVVVVPQEEAYRALDVLRSNGQRAVEIGQVTKGTGQVHFTA